MHPGRAALTAILLSSSVATAQQTTAGATSSGAHSLIGIVLDSLRGRGLPGAQVILDGTVRSALTDSAGRFGFDSLAPGEYSIAFFHPLLDSLSVAVPGRRVVVPLESGRAIMLAVPSARTLISAICPGNGDNGTSMLTGNVIDADTQEGIVGATILVSWTDVEVSREMRISFVPRIHAATTDRSGSYRVCGLPSEFDAKVTASRNGETSAELPIASERPDVIARSLTLGISSSVRGERKAVLSGTVKTVDGTPLDGARVAVPGAARVSTTDAQGRFQLSELPSGTRNVFIRRIGFVPAIVPVDLTARAPGHIDAVMEKYTAIMDTVYVRARRDRALVSVGFADRRHRGLGSYQTRSEFEKMGPRKLTDILRMMRGVRLQNSGGQTYVTGRGGGCVSLVVDRAPWMLLGPEEIDNIVYPEDIAAVEVYDGSTVPPEFEMGRYRACLTIVIWTRARIRDGDE